MQTPPFAQEADLLHDLRRNARGFVGAEIEPVELVQQEGAREAEVQPSAGDRVEHADLASELQRMLKTGRPRR